MSVTVPWEHDPDTDLWSRPGKAGGSWSVFERAGVWRYFYADAGGYAYEGPGFSGVAATREDAMQYTEQQEKTT